METAGQGVEFFKSIPDFDFPAPVYIAIAITISIFTFIYRNGRPPRSLFLLLFKILSLAVIALFGVFSLYEFS